MLCNWSSTASLLRRSFWTHSTTLTAYSQFYQRIPLSMKQGFDPLHRKIPPVNHRRLASSTMASPAPDSIVQDDASPHSLTTITNEDVSSSNAEIPGDTMDHIPTVAQISRAASQTVRMAFQEGRRHEAFLVVNSLNYSTIRYGNTGIPISAPRFHEAAIDFRRAVSPRLASHSLLHELIRLGLTKKAGKVTQQMMAMGVKVHRRSLEATIHSLCASDIAAQRDAVSQGRLTKKRPPTHLGTPEVLEFHPNMVQGECTRIAVHLLFAARRHHQHRTKRMFLSLVDACLLQGEILVATFLFAFLVKQWQLRLCRHAEEHANEDVAEENPHIAPTLRPRSKSRAPLRTSLQRCAVQDWPYPEPSIMASILSSINMSIFRRPQPDRPILQPSLEESLQALSNLASLLDSRSIPFNSISPLISALYSCPSHPKVTIWTRQHGRVIPVDARDYFLQVLDRLIKDLPTTKIPASERFRRPLPPLDGRSYNSLLHYALRHRLSPALGEKVIEHRTVKRVPPLPPDIATYNILLRSGTLLRRADVVSETLDSLRQSPENNHHGISFMLPPAEDFDKFDGHMLQEVLDRHNGLALETTRSGNNSPMMEDMGMQPAMHSRPTSKLGLMLHNASTEPIEVPSPSKLIRPTPLEADAYTLTSYICYLTASGTPDAVADLLFHILPELNLVDHPARGAADMHVKAEMYEMSHNACLQRAVSLGPYFFTVILNALRKAGRTGLAERVWMLALQAQELSWDQSFTPDVRPWCLPVHAYTIMMQCYADEGLKGFRMRRHCRQGTQIWIEQSQSDWNPKHNNRVIGWARFIVIARDLKHRLEHSKRSTAARTLAKMLYLSMVSGADAVYSSLVDVQERISKDQTLLRNLRLPIPDARFFNASLSLFGRRDDMFARYGRPRPSRWKRMIRSASKAYIQRGKLPQMYDPLLLDLTRAMRRAGFAVPLGYQRALIGTRDTRPPVEQPREWSPYPQTQRSPFRPHGHPTVKTRGLPVPKKGSTIARKIGHRRARQRTLPQT